MAVTNEDQVDGFEFASFLLFFIMIEKSGGFFFLWRNLGLVMIFIFF